jgi:hypothetical protein
LTDTVADLAVRYTLCGRYTLCAHCIVSLKFYKIENYFIFEQVKKTNLSQFTKIYSIFYPKNCNLAFKNMGMGSRIRDPEKPIPDPRSRGQKGNALDWTVDTLHVHTVYFTVNANASMPLKH